MENASEEYLKLLRLFEDGDALQNESNEPSQDDAVPPMGPPNYPTNPQLEDDETSYVTRYNSDFQSAFQTGTAIAWDILFSDSIGGNFEPNTHDRIMITAWSRAALGCEALIAYYGGKDPKLTVYNHFVDRYVVPLWPISKFKTYVRTCKVGDFNVKSVSVVNLTYRVATQWVNEVYIPATGELPHQLVYKSRPYTATLAAQAILYNAQGAYGPTVEPNRSGLRNLTDPFRGTNPIGWTNTKLSSRDNNGNWSKAELLSPDQSTICPGLSPFKRVFYENNFTAVLTS